MQALDSNDRLLAAAAWGGLCVSPFLPAVILAVSWSRPGSLARHHALRATVMWAAVLIVYLPFVVRMALGGEPDGLFYAAWGTIIAVVVVASLVNAVRALRAPLAVHPAGA